MKVLITGSEGFIGRNLVIHLLENNFSVVGVDNLYNDCKQPPIISLDYILEKGDITDKMFMESVFSKHNIESIVSLAGIASVPKSLEYPLMYLENNCVGFNILLELSKKYKVNRVVFASSSSTLGDENGEIISPYALSKLNNEQMARLYNTLYDTETIGLRFFNVFGPFQRKDSQYSAVIPKIISSSLHDTPVEIYGDGNQTRSFTFVKDIVECITKSIETENKEMYGKTFDLGAPETTSVNKLTELILHKTHSNSKVHYQDRRKGDIMHSKADISSLMKELEWEPRFSFMEGLTKTIAFYSTNRLK